MSQASRIEWTEATWNPTVGCTKISPGCKHCYAESMAKRLKAMGTPGYENGFKLTILPDRLAEPLARKKPTVYFVNSMSDLFHEDVPTEFIQAVWATMAICPQHQFQVLTKRPERMAALFADGDLQRLNHIWIGTSVEDDTVVGRIEHLLSISGMTRFVSFEPLIGPVGSISLHGIAWAIVGGESGPASRPMEIEWVEQIERACRRAETAFFFKQWGGRNKKAAGRQLRGQTFDEYPHELAA